MGISKILTFLLFLTFPYPQIHGNTELRALMEIKSSLDPKNKILTSWTSNGDPCSGSFEGVACNEHRKIANISLQGKGLSGEISPAVAGLKCLSGLYLHYNLLRGVIPVEIGNLSELVDLYLNVNQLSGTVPVQIGNMASLQVLQLCCNQLTGNIPAQMGSLKKLSVLALQHNRLSGEIPSSLGNLTFLKRLDLSFNSLFGPIPAKLGDVSKLEAFDVQNNTLSGFVPIGLKRLKDKFQYKNNPGLCGVGFSSMRACTSYDNMSIIKPSKKKNNTASKDIPESANIARASKSSKCPQLLIVVGVMTVIITLLVASFLTFFIYRRKKQKIGTSMDASDDRFRTDNTTEHYSSRSASPLVCLEYANEWGPPDFGPNKNGLSPDVLQDFRFNLDEIESATKYFSDMNLLGKSKFSSVYKGVLRDGSLVAIRTIGVTSCKSNEAEFIKGLGLLTSLRHRNVVRFRGFCCSKGRGECFLVYDFASKGNLSQYLDVDDGSSWILDWSTRVSVIHGIAKGIEYLHSNGGSKPAMVHRNISVNKILLDQKFNPLISDSGLSKILADDIIFSTLKNSAAMGYMAPEYITAGSFTEKSDVYVYGVIVLQILSGKTMLNNSIRVGAESGKFEDFVDTNMKGKFSESEAGKLAKIAMACISEVPDHRPTMEAVIQDLGNFGISS